MPSSTSTPEEKSNSQKDLLESILKDLKSEFGKSLVEDHVEEGRGLWIRFNSDAWAAAATLLKFKGFSFFDWLSAIDWASSPYGRSLDSQVDIDLGKSTRESVEDSELKTGYAGGTSRFQMLARLYSLDKKAGIILKADLDESLTIDSWVDVFPGAAWHEREAYEMFGINFMGHENLRNIYLPTGFEGNPLRKDYPLLSRLVKPWPGIVDVEPMAESTPNGASTTNPGLESK